MKFISIVIAALTISFSSVYSQSELLPGQWSIALSGNINTNFGVSTAMQGTAEEFKNEILYDYNNTKYPFGDDMAQSLFFGCQLAYRFDESPISAYMSYSNTYFVVDPTQILNIERTWMIVTGLTFGAEYTLGDYKQLWNTFGRAGINFNLIMGEVTYWGNSTEVDPEGRIGFEAEFGGRLNIPSTPLALELAANYTNANLIGKSYSKPLAVPPDELSARNLNDGKNPDNPNDDNKTISYLSLRVGIRLWL